MDRAWVIEPVWPAGQARDWVAGGAAGHCTVVGAVAWHVDETTLQFAGPESHR